MARQKYSKKAQPGTKRSLPEDANEIDANGKDPLLTDSRFNKAIWDPRFSRVPKRAKGAVDDDRFKTKLKEDPSFREKFTPVDRFGRPKKRPTLNSSLKLLAADDDNSADKDFDSDEEIEPGATIPFSTEEDEDDDDDSEEDSDIEDFVEDGSEELEDIPCGNATKRLAVVGLNWSVTRAVDILASLNSFCPTGKRIEFVEVHPSKFGLERLAIEAKLGPQVIEAEDLKVVKDANNRFVITKVENHDDILSDGDDEDETNSPFQDAGDKIEEASDDGSDQDEDDDHQNERLQKQQAALRRYEEERLKYYYAAVQFEDIKTADAVYEQCDGVEYAQSGQAFDLRFIPDDMMIETSPRDRADCIPDGYAPPNVNLSSLNSSTVKLSWDADNPDRVILKKKAFTKHEMDEDDLKAYLASSSDENEDDDKLSRKDIERKRKLLLGTTENKTDDGKDDIDLEVTFEPGMLEKGEEILKQKLEKDEHKDDTPWEARLRRIRERKSEKRKLRRELLTSRGREDEGALAEKQDGDVEKDENPSFEDPFFSIERDFDELESKSRAEKDKFQRQRERKLDEEGPPNDMDHDELKQRRQAELELISMGDEREKRNGNSLRQALLAADSDDEEERRQEKKGKRTRGKRRWQKETNHIATVKPSMMDTNDERFQGVFNSHLFAIDPTHPKFRENETTRNIIQEKGRRARKQANGEVAIADNIKGVVDTDPIANNSGKGDNNAQSELRQLAARLKERAKAKKSQSKV